MFVSFLESYLVVARTQIQSAKNPHMTNTVENIVNEWQGVFVFDGLSVELAIVNTKSHAAVLFLNKEHGCSKRRSTGSNEVLGKEII